MYKTKLFPVLIKKLDQLEGTDIPENRKKVLQPLIDFIQQQKNSGEAIKLNFICTHNSRRSQLAQVWAQAISAHFGIKTECFSGGTEETVFFKNAVETLRETGFIIKSGSGENPHFQVFYSEEAEPLVCYSKVYDAPENPTENFAAVMTCSHADENCPFIPGSKARIPLDYKDPKQFDDTPLAMEKYEERSDQIASEMIYVFQHIK
ncbi:protein-tyrosine-phosphatase [Christiangramia gaetbulicola]|uniref:Protein-tyrosine-phosphatase n=1 Tax=Christiangramia gaetbulicola TaxID=703340 RepID=A0A2T6AF54_9FLAO|nr:protein-tyrosine-phosphatase [Christiangramia gaetbulicola]PTX42448.1 protein-tyrosine-phosphatase [Christiangramia gaetbulicola]